MSAVVSAAGVNLAARLLMVARFSDRDTTKGGGVEVIPWPTPGDPPTEQMGYG